MIHETKSKYAGKKVKVDTLGIMVIEDWWDSDGNNEGY